MTDDEKHKLRERIADIVMESKKDPHGYVGCIWAADAIINAMLEARK